MARMRQGSGFENCAFNWDHADLVYARFTPISVQGHGVSVEVAFDTNEL
jgi:hypothetical protein